MRKKIKKTIPNILTLFNLFFGCISITLLQSKHFEYSSLFTMFSLILDLLDGFLSRFFHIENEFGKELDSLADMVSFGLVPSMIVFDLLKKNKGIPFIEWSSFLITIFSAWRLALFNITKEKNYYGLTTPINTLFFSSLSVILSKKNIVLSPVILLIIVFLSCYFLISKIPMFSLHFYGFYWKKNRTRYLFLLISMFLLLTLHMVAFPCIIVFYIITSICYHCYQNKLNRKKIHINT
ncbi:CDP-alcohol phosphatidyltransferase family protein [Blattabacterium cuenoti]|uniref:CDP-alcohol phosphatidyltransferase family protein n=1 Tax=Blattabacterium cuenoti TaxID=1653831 RepID=UPI00163D01F0|nr:CDP-alcohol phosphatidyltransferase family protein [Blattabacterium cuenoti]